ncbi:hypothetical protein [Clostridium sp. Marseille-P3244]|nr:hypothetical protein [Clostridium sp. Marseille-P3244]
MAGRQEAECIDGEVYSQEKRCHVRHRSGMGRHSRGSAFAVQNSE